MDFYSRYNTLGYRLENLRQSRDLKQKEVAKALHVTSQTYCHYEHGNRTPDLYTAVRIAKFFRVPIDYLVDPDFSAKTAISKYLPKALYALPPEAIRELFDFYHYLYYKYNKNRLKKDSE